LQIAEKLARDGWLVRIEEPVNGHADIYAQRQGRKLAVEIETGKSDWRANVQKNVDHGFGEIIIIATNAQALSRIASGLKDLPSGIQVNLTQASEFLEASNVNYPSPGSSDEAYDEGISPIPPK